MVNIRLWPGRNTSLGWYDLIRVDEWKRKRTREVKVVG
jgi:hypothetical protein